MGLFALKDKLQELNKNELLIGTLILHNIKDFYIVVTEKCVKNYYEISPTRLHDLSIKTKNNQLYCIHMFYFFKQLSSCWICSH